MSKEEMLWAIFREAKNAAILENKFFDGADLFFTLAFMSEKELLSVYKKIIK